MSENLGADLNATIASAVNARVEAAVLAALSGDDVLGRYVSAALNQEIELDRNYRKVKVNFLHHTIKTAIQEATKAAINAAIAEEREQIEELVRKAIKSQAANLAAQMATSLVEQAAKGYIRVEVKVPGEG